MRKSKLCISYPLLVLLFTLRTSTAFADRKYFSFVNHSGRVIRHIYIIRSGYSYWVVDDCIRGAVLRDGDSCECWYNDNFRYFDVRVVFSGGLDAIFYRHDFNNQWRLSIFLKGDTYCIKSN